MAGSKKRTIHGKPILEAKRPVRLNVTLADCKNAIPQDAHRCALAVAAKRQLKCQDAFVHLSVMYAVYPKAVVRYQLQSSAMREQYAFDKGAKFSPGEYGFRPLQPSKREERQSVMVRPFRKSHRATGKRYGGKLPYMAGKGEKRPPAVRSHLRPPAYTEFDKKEAEA